MNKRIYILLVEDDQVDVMTIQRAFKEISITNPTVIRENGLEALEYLRDTNNHPPLMDPE